MALSWPVLRSLASRHLLINQSLEHVQAVTLWIAGDANKDRHGHVEETELGGSFGCMAELRIGYFSLLFSRIDCSP